MSNSSSASATDNLTSYHASVGRGSPLVAPEIHGDGLTAAVQPPPGPPAWTCPGLGRPRPAGSWANRSTDYFGKPPGVNFLQAPGNPLDLNLKPPHFVSSPVSPPLTPESVGLQCLKAPLGTFRPGHWSKSHRGEGGGDPNHPPLEAFAAAEVSA